MSDNNTTGPSLKCITESIKEGDNKGYTFIKGPVKVGSNVMSNVTLINTTLLSQD